jgi:hypothetical protein
MAKVVAAIVAVLVLIAVLGGFGLELYHQGAAQVQDRANLVTALAANQTQADALARLQADRAADAAQVSALVVKLQTISAEQTSQRAAFAKVTNHATPAEQALLGSHLPAAVVQLFPRSAGAAATGATGSPVHP